MATFMTSGLQFEAPRKNVFVTQLDRKDDDEDPTLRKFPLVQDPPRQLLTEGRNTLQSTLLLQKRKEMVEVQADLERQRDQFAQRMRVCAEKQLELRNKQKQIKDRVRKFEKFLKDNDAKRQRANQKYLAEMKLREQKERDYDELVDQQTAMRVNSANVKKTLDVYRKYETYLQRVVESLPEDYLEVPEPQIKDIMMRHKTLSETNDDLVKQVQRYYDEIEHKQGLLGQLIQENSKILMLTNSKLATTQKRLESAKQRTAHLEQMIFEREKAGRKQVREFREIRMAIHNIAERCMRNIGVHQGDTLNEKLATIQERLLDLEAISSIASRDGPIGSADPSHRTPSKAGAKPSKVSSASGQKDKGAAGTAIAANVSVAKDAVADKGVDKGADKGDAGTKDAKAGTDGSAAIKTDDGSPRTKETKPRD